MDGYTMSPRQLYRLVLIVAIFLVVGSSAYHFLDPLSDTPDRLPSTMNVESRTLLDKATVNRGYVLSVGSQAIEYTLPGSAHMVRLSTNANLKNLDGARQQRQVDPARRWKYALEIEEFNARGETIHQRVVHFQRDLVEIEMPDGKSGTGAFYLSEQAPKPLATAAARIDLSGVMQPAKLRIRMIEADPDIADVLLRLDVPEPVSPRNAQAVWRRLSDEQRERLASGNVFPPELLVEQERLNVVASRWRALGPTGPAVDRDLYVLPSKELGPPTEALKPAALTTGPEHDATVQLPEQGGKIRILLDPTDEVTKTGSDVTVSWYGHSPFERSTQAYQWKDNAFELTQNYKGGWLQITSSRNAIVRVWTVEAGQEKEITPPIGYTRIYPASTSTPLDYAVTHVGSQPTPIRLVLRRLAGPAQRIATSPVSVSFLDAAGNVIRTNQLKLDWMPSRFDRQWPYVPGSIVTDPVEVFFNVPSQAPRLRIHSDEPVAVVAFTRPGDLPRAVRTPEDSVSPDAEKLAIPGWFALQPLDFEERVLNGGTQLLAVQARPPVDRPDLTQGRYSWEDFRPSSGGATRVFFAPREPGVPDRPEAAAVTYRPMPADGRVNLVAEPGRGQLTPHLAWVAKGRQHDNRFNVAVDGRRWAEGAIGAAVGETILPSLPAGPHRLRITDGTNVDWFITHHDSGPAWVRRSAQQFDRRLQFLIDRTSSEEEFISVRLFRPAGSQQRMKVRVWVDAPKPTDPIGPMEGWLFTERIHDIRPSGQYALPLAETGGERTDAGQPFYIPFPKGSPQGQYRITLIPEGGTGWIAVSRIMPGRFAKPRLLIEEVQRER